ncbi:unnamed protein product [Schistosoma margrebowiei]|uniref:Uncharacterized protein n=1 Tax=Schistosoma margrebowiei TaxID=48269 RepID=A0A183LBL6_9TREM|nr:unnamed protein product [Schistosoma margrebowiei]
MRKFGKLKIPFFRKRFSLCRERNVQLTYRICNHD